MRKREFGTEKRETKDVEYIALSENVSSHYQVLVKSDISTKISGCVINTINQSAYYLRNAKAKSKLLFFSSDLIHRLQFQSQY